MSDDITVETVRFSLEVAETLARVTLLTSPAAKRRLAARSLEMKYGHLDELGDFIPSQQVLMYLVRMGSFNSTPKILNNDDQDSTFELPESINRQELLEHCGKHVKMYPMIKRSIRQRKRSDVDEIVYDLKFQKLSLISKDCNGYNNDSPYNIRILQWNILSQTLGVMNDNFAKCPSEALDWNFRKYRIVEELIEYWPDVICLQEVDHFNFLKHVLETQGYEGIFFPKPDSPCLYIEGNNGPDGCAIFYRKSKFDIVKTENRILEVWRVQSNQVAILVILRIRETGQEVAVIATHMKARKGALLSTLRNEQGKDLLNFIMNHINDHPTILCGDFNAEPNEPIYNTMLQHQKLCMGSAYADCNNSHSNSSNGEPPYTTWKIREEGEVCHTIDYIFYSKNRFQVDAVLDFPNGEEIGEGRCPSMCYPSDHFSLLCDLSFKSNPTF